MDYSTYLVGPHLIGLLFIIIGLLQRYLPPKNINRWYGYRTATAKASQKAWDEGNRFSALFMMRAGLFVLIAGFLVYTGMLWQNVDYNIVKTVSFFILFGGAMGIGIASTIATEKHLKKLFSKPAIKKRR